MWRQATLFNGIHDVHLSPGSVSAMTIGGRLPRAAEFFAGIGLVRLALDRVGVDVVWANDIEPIKQRVYEENFPGAHFLLDDIRKVRGRDVPEIDIATASFPCTDLSLAGNRKGLAGPESGLFWEFSRVLSEIKKKPTVVILENVPGLLTSHGGADLRAAILAMNDLGYWCDVIAADARWFVPQSRPRLFIIASLDRMGEPHQRVDIVHPRRNVEFVVANRDLKLQSLDMPYPRDREPDLSQAVERFSSRNAIWWDRARAQRFTDSLSPVQTNRLASLEENRTLTWRTAYRRTRGGVPQWEIRPDGLAGCLRTARGGSSKQAVVEAGRNRSRVRWMTPREYARLQGVPDDFTFESVTENQALFGFGDAVCVPTVEWVLRGALHCIVDSVAKAS